MNLHTAKVLISENFNIMLNTYSPPSQYFQHCEYEKFNIGDVFLVDDSVEN